jgi:phasin family protein
MANKTGNPFLDQDFSEMFDFKKYMQNFNVPGMENNPLMEMQKKNLEAITHANRVAFEGAQAVIKRQNEIVRQAMQEAQDAMKELNNAGTTEDRVAKQTEIAKQAYETALKNLQELAEMAQKSNGEAMEHINKRVTESFDEMREGMQQVTKQAQKAASPNGSGGGASKK